MVTYVYRDKIILAQAKRGSRLLRIHTLPLENYICNNLGPKMRHSQNVNITIDGFFELLKNSNKQILCINRNPISHITSGLWNTLEFEYDRGKDFKTEILNYIQDKQNNRNEGIQFEIFNKFFYVSVDPADTYKNVRNTKLYEVLSESELLNILNFHIIYFNKFTDFFINSFATDPHLNPNQSFILEILKQTKCKIVDMDDSKNLLSKLGFLFSDAENERVKNLYSQRASKQFYSIFLNYMLDGDVQKVINSFKDMYGKCSVVSNSTLVKIKKCDEIINFINEEVKLYNEIKVKSNNTTSI